ncbi:MAG: hypothetical protein M3354_00790 [Chloroflexota bacterium]|nr:hypothetical protein [Chloroflexota bacterium]
MYNYLSSRDEGVSGKVEGESMQNGGESADEIRIDLLRRLAEQAMTDAQFRAAAREDLVAALVAHGYDLNNRELALVVRFREALADAGVDLDLGAGLSNEQIADLLRGQNP